VVLRQQLLFLLLLREEENTSTTPNTIATIPGEIGPILAVDE